MVPGNCLCRRSHCHAARGALPRIGKRWVSARYTDYFGDVVRLSSLDDLLEAMESEDVFCRADIAAQLWRVSHVAQANYRVITIGISARLPSLSDRRRAPGYRRGTSPAPRAVSGVTAAAQHTLREQQWAAVRLDEPPTPLRPAGAGAERLINTRLSPCSGTRVLVCGWPARAAAVPGGYPGIFDRSGESATCRVEEPVLGEWCLGWSIEHPGMDCLDQGSGVLP
jgi:hypothetical protein